MNKGTTNDSVILDVEVRVELPLEWNVMGNNQAINAALTKLLDQTGLEPTHYTARVTWSNSYFSVKFHWYNIPRKVSYADLEAALHESVLKIHNLEQQNKDLNENMEKLVLIKVEQLFDKDPDVDENGDADINGWASASTRKL